MRTTAPATGTCRWLSDAPNGNRRLLINDKEYEVQVVKTGYVLHRVDDRGNFTRYVIDTRPPADSSLPRGAWTCSCPDAQYRRTTCCKHVRALQAALRALPF